MVKIAQSVWWFIVAGICEIGGGYLVLGDRTGRGNLPHPASFTSETPNDACANREVRTVSAQACAKSQLHVQALAQLVQFNITFSLGIKALFLLLALVGKATLWMAVAADMGASLLVVANSLRLLTIRGDPE